MEQNDKANNDPRLSITEQRMTIIFNEWAKRYAESPEDFLATLDDNGNPVSDYGQTCTFYFNNLAEELDENGLLPRPQL